MSENHNIGHGLSFPIIFLFLPFVAFILIASFNVFFASVAFTFLFIYVLSTEGIEIDTKNNKYKKYVAYAFIRIGKWKSLEGYTNICILKKKIAHSQVSRSMRTNNFTTDLTAIYLTDKTHRYKIFLTSSPGYFEAERRAKGLAQLLNKPYETYSPIVSQKTMNRRR